MAVRLTGLTDLSDPRQIEELNRMLREMEVATREGVLSSEVERPSDRNANGGAATVQSPGASEVRLRAVPKTGVGEDGEYELRFFDGKKEVVV